MASTEKIAEYAAALSVLLRTTPLEKIRVKDICAQCGTDRQNFYYYFQDKYDLAVWIYKLDYQENLVSHSGSLSVKQLAGMLERMHAKLDIYNNLFSDTSPNSLFSYMLAAEFERFSQFRAAKGITVPISSEEKCEAAFELAGFFHLMVEWLRGAYAFSPLAFAALTYRMLSDDMKRAYGLLE